MVAGCDFVREGGVGLFCSKVSVACLPFSPMTSDGSTRLGGWCLL